jgi:hypothetical protein
MHNNTALGYLIIIAIVGSWVHAHKDVAIGLGTLVVLLGFVWWWARRRWLRSLADRFVARPSMLGGVLDGRAKARILRAQGWRCNVPGCGADLRHARHWDHIVPRARGGRDDISNRHALCAPCNLSKGAKDWAVFLASRPWRIR